MQEPDGSTPDDVVTATVELRLRGRPVHLPIVVPRGPAPLQAVLPVFQALADAVVAAGEDGVAEQGLSVSCRKGCGACCRQPVPVSYAEALALADYVAALPEPRRSNIRARFADAVRRMDAAGLRTALAAGPLGEPALHAAGQAYFQLGVACPFLEDEACSIHAVRPVACREYLVTSPAANCTRPTADTVQPVPLPARVGRAVRALERQSAAAGGGWLPLVLALEWAAARTPAAQRPGTAWVEDGFALVIQPVLADWIRADNLGAFVTAVAWSLGATLAADAHDRLVAAVAQTDAASERWCTLELKGDESARLRLGRAAAGDAIGVWLEAPRRLHAQLELAIGLCQRYALR